MTNSQIAHAADTEAKIAYLESYNAYCKAGEDDDTAQTWAAEDAGVVYDRTLDALYSGRMEMAA